MTYFNRPTHEQDIIRKAYDFEVKAIEECDASRNPWRREILSWADGEAVWEGINEALEMAYSH